MSAVRDARLLSGEERAAIAGGRWFASLPAMVRHDLLRVLRVRRHASGERIFAQGEAAPDWLGCAAGAVRIAFTTKEGKPRTLNFVRPGRWFGAPPLGEEDRRSHDAHAQGATTTVAVARGDLLDLIQRYPAFATALVRLQSLRLHQALGLVEELANLGLRARLARRLHYLMLAHGETCRDGEVRIRLRLQQHLLAEWMGCSRQRINEQLRALAADEVIRREKGMLVVRDPGRLAGFVAAG